MANKHSEDLEVTELYGRRGSGKTTKALELLKHQSRKRVFIYDLKGEYPYKKIYGKAAWARWAKKNWFKEKWKIAYVPDAKEKSEHIAELSEMCYALCSEQKKNVEQGRAQNLTILAEEMSMTAPNQRYKNGEGGFEYAVNIARSWGLEIIGVSQRPAQVNPDFRGNSSQSYFFSLPKKLDRDAVRSTLDEQTDLLKNILPHQYFHVDIAGKVTRGKNKANFK